MFFLAFFTFLSIAPSNYVTPPSPLPEAAEQFSEAETQTPYPVSPFDTSRGSTTEKITSAQDEAAHWLALIDQGQYAASWMDSGPLLKDIISQTEWVGAMNAVRRPFGNVLDRKKALNQSTSSLPNGTKGNFIMLTYTTKFSRNVTGTESLVLITNQLGQFRVISYSIK